MLRITESVFIASITRLRDKPGPNLPEFAVAGRSNVGKSSLINCLVNINNFARVSKSPGKTRTINYYLLNQSFYLVDLPGYGYAKVSKQEQKNWQLMIENYLLKNQFLKQIYVLVDAEIGLKKNDLQLFEWLSFHHIRHKIIMTKADKVKRGQRNLAKIQLQKQLQINNTENVILFSSKTRIGKADLLADLHKLLA